MPAHSLDKLLFFRMFGHIYPIKVNGTPFFQIREHNENSFDLFEIGNDNSNAPLSRILNMGAKYFPTSSMQNI